MSEHDCETFSGLCQDCGAVICVGSRCVPCATKSLVRADLARLRAEHGPACGCLSCIKARASVRSAA